LTRLRETWSVTGLDNMRAEMRRGHVLEHQGHHVTIQRRLRPGLTLGEIWERRIRRAGHEWEPWQSSGVEEMDSVRIWRGKEVGPS
jgi:hypothetical protein